MKRLPCWWIFFHDWPKWSEAKPGTLRTGFDPPRIETTTIQDRLCTKCNKRKVRLAQ